MHQDTLAIRYYDGSVDNLTNSNIRQGLEKVTCMNRAAEKLNLAKLRNKQ